MRNNCSGVTKIGRQRTHLNSVKKISAAFDAAFYFKSDDVTAHFHLFYGSFVVGMGFQEGIFYEFNFWVIFKKLSNFQSIFAMFFNPYRKRFKAFT